MLLIFSCPNALIAFRKKYLIFNIVLLYLHSQTIDNKIEKHCFQAEYLVLKFGYHLTDESDIVLFRGENY